MSESKSVLNWRLICTLHFTQKQQRAPASSACHQNKTHNHALTTIETSSIVLYSCDTEAKDITETDYMYRPKKKLLLSSCSCEK